MSLKCLVPAHERQHYPDAGDSVTGK